MTTNSLIPSLKGLGSAKEQKVTELVKFVFAFQITGALKA